MRAKFAALPKLRSNHEARSNNVTIWRLARPLYLWMRSLWRIAHRGSIVRNGRCHLFLAPDVFESLWRKLNANRGRCTAVAWADWLRKLASYHL